MAHFVRPLALAETLEPDRYDIHFYAPSRYSGHLDNKPFTTGELASMPGEAVPGEYRQRPTTVSADTIRGYVAQDRELIRSIRPDLVVGDMRLSLPSARGWKGLRTP